MSILSHQVSIVIPIYKVDLSSLEKISFNQCIKILGHYPITIIKPHHLDITEIQKAHPFIKIESFENNYFKDIDGYNRLMLSSIFYERFLSYTFILIYQLDAFVFKDELLLWCNKNYDYIGAPFGPRYRSLFGRIKLSYRKWKANRNNIVNEYAVCNCVGNGGFSLRKTKVFYSIALTNQKQINHFINNANIYNEDVFWGIAINKREKRISIPPFKEALHFSIEQNPILAIKYNHSLLPFGCHGWYRRKDWFSFWSHFIPIE